MVIKTKHILLVSIIIISGLIHFLNLSGVQGWGDDFALYLYQAKSLATGNMDKCIADVSFIAKNSTYIKTPLFGFIPWGLPILLSLIYHFFGLNFLIMQIFILILFLLALVVIYCLFKDRLDSVSTLFLVSIFAFNPYLTELNNHILSDIPYLFFSLFSILLIDRFVIKEKFLINKTFSLIALGFFIFYAYFVRSNGLILIPALLICQIVKIRKHANYGFKDLIPYVVFMASLIFTKRILPDLTVISQFKYMISSLSDGNISQILNNIKLYAEVPAQFFNPHLSKVIYGFTLPFLLLGVIKNRKEDYLFILYSVFTFMIFIVYPDGWFFRYILSVMPFYIYFTFVGLVHISNKLRYSNNNLKMHYVFGILLVIYFILQSSLVAYLQVSHKKVEEGPLVVESKEVFDFIRNNTAKNDVIIFSKPLILPLFIERRSIDTSNLSDYRKGEYLLLNEYLDGDLYNNQLFRKGDLFRKVFENKKFLLFKIIK